MKPEQKLPTNYWIVRLSHDAKGRALPPRLFWTQVGLQRFMEQNDGKSYDVWNVDLTTGRVRCSNGQPLDW